MYERILVAIDGSRPSRLALDEAIGLAHDQGARLRIVHVASAEGDLVSGTTGTASFVPAATVGSRAAVQLLRGAEARARAQSVAVETAVLEEQDRIAPTVVAEALRWSADLIVVGTHGRSGLQHFLAGSIAESIVRTSPVTVLLVRLAEQQRSRGPRGGKRVRVTDLGGRAAAPAPATVRVTSS